MPQWIHARVHPGASQDRCEQTAPDRFEVWVRAKPVEGRATEAVAGLIGQALHVPASRVRLRRGAHSRTKLFEVI